jgi:hypothetical protein
MEEPKHLFVLFDVLEHVHHDRGVEGPLGDGDAVDRLAEHVLQRAVDGVDVGVRAQLVGEARADVGRRLDEDRLVDPIEVAPRGRPDARADVDDSPAKVRPKVRHDPLRVPR